MSAPVRSRSARRHRPMALSAVLALSLLTVAPSAMAQDNQPNGATIQWAQQILDQQGFYQGRASGKMDSATAAAIAAYQKKNGLRATGRLDQATIDSMMRGRPERTGVGNLADPNSRARASQPVNLREADVKPTAAPTAAAVDRGQGTESTVLGVSRGGGEVAATLATTPPAASSSLAPPPAAASGMGGSDLANPAAAPRSTVETEVTHEGPQGAAGFNPASLPDWVRYGVIGGIGALLVGMLGFWWGSGRRQVKPAARTKASGRPTPPPPPPGPARREPTLGGPPPGPGGRRDPVFTAPARDPRRAG
ncbi:peptidoglycan-binding domain-containing protein [Niveispirillum lacus]|uniref:peptidoglycan-binding domain-containing protein n=1 Tax=Niveispirillum lacus TaxID=1981099 RepID=UPI0013FD41DD|nr:peptidoglycan-binding domain-containing protein [Niveispirillum lacus]